jgi:hypothetical protein
LKGKCIRRILGPVYDNEKENWRILTDKEIYANRNNKVSRIFKRMLYMSLETRLRGRPR